ncbi:hypothetical protein N9E02_01675 [Ilumatobacteraceae bacterium]|nr:hypothetical protein [Ilumatobacteraceae bacterium]
MTRTRFTRFAVGIAALSVVAAACGGDDPVAEEPAAQEPAAEEPAAEEPAADGVDLSADCPNPVVVQTDWFPEAEHGALYNLIGDGYTVDTDNKVVRGPMVLDGHDLGIEFEVRTGGPAIGYAPVTSYVYTDDAITFGYANTEAQVLSFEDAPLLSVVAPLEINPQMIMWDPETYPEIETLADLGSAGVAINVFGGGVFSEVFVAQGTWSADQIDPSYDGSPARFISEGGAIAQQGFASAEPYDYLNNFSDWGKEIRFQTLHDAGFQVYAATLGIRPDQKASLDACLKKIVPVFQQSVVSYVAAPDSANAVIVDAVTQFADSWTQSPEITAWSIAQQVELGLVGNGPDSTLGNMDAGRIQKVIDDMAAAGMAVPSGLTAADLHTNEYIDTSIGL